MRLREYLEGEDLFSEIKGAGGLDFINEDDLPVMNDLLTLEYGERLVYLPFNNMSIETVAGLIAVKFRSKWEGYVKAETILDNVNVRREVVETINNDETTANENSETSKVSAYDSPTLIDDSGRENSYSGTSLETRQRELTDELIDPEKAYRMLDRTTRNGIINRVISDVSGFFTLSIY